MKELDDSKKWYDLDLESFREVVDLAVEKAFERNPTLKNRLENLVSQTLIHRSRERKWCKDLVRKWFARQWRNRMSERKRATKRKANATGLDEDKTCPECQTDLVLVCPCCNDLKHLVSHRTHNIWLTFSVRQEGRDRRRCAIS